MSEIYLYIFCSLCKGNKPPHKFHERKRQWSVVNGYLLSARNPQFVDSFFIMIELIFTFIIKFKLILFIHLFVFQLVWISDFRKCIKYGVNLKCVCLILWIIFSSYVIELKFIDWLHLIFFVVLFCWKLNLLLMKCDDSFFLTMVECKIPQFD